MENRINRRNFIKSLMVGLASASMLLDFNKGVFGAEKKGAEMDDLYYIQTVLSRIKPSQLGMTLIHEHIIVDFIGADKFDKNRYDPDEVFEVMLPYLKELKSLGVTGFAECTPMFLARDAELFERLAKATDMHILTNTGLYKEPYLPKYAFEKTADELAEIWIDEFKNGIEGTAIKPGFIKIAVNPGNLIPIQQKIVLAAAKTCLATGMTIASHTVSGIAALEQLDILEKEKVPLNKFIFVHAGGENNQNLHFQVAQRGAWVEYDNVSRGTSAQNLQLIKAMLEKGYENKLLISHDAGWYNVGQPRGGNINGFTYIPKDFVPLMKQSGIDQNIIDKLLITNPALALAIPKGSNGIKGVNLQGKAISTFGMIKSPQK